MRSIIALPTLAGPAPKTPLAPQDLLLSLALGLIFNLALPAVGLALILRGDHAFARARTLLRLPLRGPLRDLLDGQAVIGLAASVFVVGFLGAAWLRSSAGVDVSHLYDRAGAPLLLAIALGAALGEEFLFRGLLLAALRRRMPEGAAVGLQALLFGLAHAGQGDPLTVIGPAALGLAAGMVAVRFGLLAAILLHFEADVAFFALSTRDPFLSALGIAAGVGGLLAFALRPKRVLGPLLAPGRNASPTPPDEP